MGQQGPKVARRDMQGSGLSSDKRGQQGPIGANRIQQWPTVANRGQSGPSDQYVNVLSPYGPGVPHDDDVIVAHMSE